MRLSLFSILLAVAGSLASVRARGCASVCKGKMNEIIATGPISSGGVCDTILCVGCKPKHTSIINCDKVKKSKRESRKLCNVRGRALAHLKVKDTDKGAFVCLDGSATPIRRSSLSLVLGAFRY